MNKISNIIKVSFTTNFFLALIKVITGSIFKSSALLADGIHSFSDLITDVVAIIGNKLSNKPADYEHPYGHGKTEYITNLIIGLVIIIIGMSLISTTMHSKITIPSIIVIVISIFTIITKFSLSTFLIHKGKKLHNTILIASGKESSMDVISSVVVLISSTLMQLSNQIIYLKYADKIASIIVGLFIVNAGYQLIKENISIILGEQETDSIYIETLKEELKDIDFIKSIDNFVLIKYGPYYQLSMEISMDGNISLKEAHINAHKIEDKLKQKDSRISYINIHINSYENE